MKIENNYTNYELQKRPLGSGQPVTGSGQSISESKKGSAQEKGSIQDAVVNLSQASKEALLIETTIADTPDIRDEKVLALKEKIATGQYEMNPQAIADKMVDHFAKDFMVI
ncbi:MAG: flagellar biosynthesis anti-sigma factor FlgM [Desulfobacterium sp.]